MADSQHAARAMGMAQAFHRADRILELKVHDEEFGEDKIAAAGCGVGLIVLRLLAVELALKALNMQETRSEPDHTHNLKALFQRLSPALQCSLETQFQQARQALSVHDGQPDTLLEIFASCGDDFTRWRYLHEDNGDMYVPLRYLFVFLRVALREYDRRLLGPG